MQKEKRRPTLDELRAMPLDLLHMEIAQLCLDAGLADNADVLREAEYLMIDPAPSPEFIVELWNQLRGVSCSTEEYSCGYNTVSGAFHRPGCDGDCGIMNPDEAVKYNRIGRRN